MKRLPTKKETLLAFEEFRSKNEHAIRSLAIPHLLGGQWVGQLPRVDRKIKNLAMVDPAKAEIKTYRFPFGGPNESIRVRCCLELARGTIRHGGREGVEVTLYYAREESHEDCGLLLREIRDGSVGFEFFWILTTAENKQGPRSTRRKRGSYV